MRNRIVFSLFGIALVGSVAYILLNQTLFQLDTQTARTLIESRRSGQDLEITSGGALIVKDGIVSMLSEETTPQDEWYIYNPDNKDLVKALYPQIVFRAITPASSLNWTNYQVTLSITPREHIVSESLEVDGTDGIHVFLHYHDQDNLYVAGLTKDGRMTIKRKASPNGHAYYGLLAEQRVFEGVYERNSNLITPFEHANIRLTATINNLNNGDVQITFLAVILNPEGKVVFSRELVGIDDGLLIAQENGTEMLGPPSYEGRAGMRLDSIVATINEFTVSSVLNF